MQKGKKVEEALHESEERYRFMFENHPQPMFIYDLETLAFLQVNKTIVEQYGYSKEEFLSMTLKDIHRPEDLDKLMEDIERARYSDNPSGEWLNVKKNGELIYTEIVAQTVLFNNRPARHILTNDITKRKQTENALRDSEEQFRLLFNISPDALFLLDENGKFIDANQVAINRYGYSLDEFRIMTPKELAAPILKEKALQQVKSATQKEIHFEWIHCAKNGHEFPVEIHSKPTIIHGKKCMFVEVRDITDRKLAEESLIQLNDRLKASNITKAKLFTIIAHDLKSPFNSILGFSDLLISNLHTYEIAKTGDFIKQINTSAKNTLSLIDNLLAWANSQMGQISYQPENILLLPVIQEIIEFLSPTAKIKNIAIRYFESDIIEAYADKNLLQIVIRNLISNAIKFTNPKGIINVYAILENNQIVITISDNGVGISDNDIGKLFDINENFTTNGTGQEKGSGLGLILCKEFVEKQGGRIWVESELGAGSEFKFTLPMNQIK